MQGISEAQHKPLPLNSNSASKTSFSSICPGHYTINLYMAILESFVDSSDLSKEEISALSQDFSVVPDDPRLRLP